MMHSTSAVAILLVLSTTVLGDTPAYILIDAEKIPLSAHQPTWIALTELDSGHKLIHVPAGRGIAALKPGRYRIAHIDFQQSQNSGIGTLSIPGSTIGVFEVTQDSVLYIGLLRIKRGGCCWWNDPSSINLVSSMDIVKRACKSEPEVMARSLVKVITKDREVQYLKARCEIE